MSQDRLGDFEYQVLVALMNLRKEDAYGVPLRRELERRTGRAPAVGALYTTLDRMEAKGFIKSTTGEPTAARGGRAKRMLEVTGAGQTAIQRTEAHLRTRFASLQPWGALA